MPPASRMHQRTHASTSQPQLPHDLRQSPIAPLRHKGPNSPSFHIPTSVRPETITPQSDRIERAPFRPSITVAPAGSQRASNRRLSDAEEQSDSVRTGRPLALRTEAGMLTRLREVGFRQVFISRALSHRVAGLFSRPNPPSARRTTVHRLRPRRHRRSHRPGSRRPPRHRRRR